MGPRLARLLSIMMMTVLSAVALGGAARADLARTRAAADPADLATASEAIDALAAALPELVAVTGGGQLATSDGRGPARADIPECTGAATADTLAADAGGLLQSFGGEAGGGSGQIVVFDSKKLAKRFFKLVTSDDAQACTVASTELGLMPLSGGAAAVAELRRGKLRGVKGSVTLEGTIALGELEVLETEATVRRGTVVIRGTVGEFGGSGAGLGATFNDWVKATAKQF